MIPRQHKRGASFKGVCKYILHDAGKETTDRVLWKATANIVSNPEQAWFEMYATARDQNLLKQQSGKDARGRKNTKPVFHYTLSWAVSDNPTPEHMRETALDSLKALKLDQHQALLSAHKDKEHLHVHIVVNTVHPLTGMTASLKFTKEALQDWAREYELKHGIHCEQRMANHEKRQERSNEKSNPNRRRHLQKSEIVERMKRYRAEIDHKHLVERDVTWTRHRQEFAELVATTKEAANVAQTHVEKNYKRRWRDLYAAQRKEAHNLDRYRDNLFERAVFVFVNSERLGNGKALSFRAKVGLICSQIKLVKAVDRLHARERNGLAQAEKADVAEFLERVWKHHQPRFDALRSRQSAERLAEKLGQGRRAHDSVSYLRARNELILERDFARPRRMATNAPLLETDAEYTSRIRAEIETYYSRRFGQSRPSPASLSTVFKPATTPTAPKPAAAIKAEIEEWRRKNPGRDFGREM